MRRRQQKDGTHPSGIVMTVFPDLHEEEFRTRLQALQAIIASDREMQMGHNQDYQWGYDIGKWLWAQGEYLDFKELDGIAQDIIQQRRLKVKNLESFREGLANGYVIASTRGGLDRRE